jgi:hypothetical protein
MGGKVNRHAFRLTRLWVAAGQDGVAHVDGDAQFTGRCEGIGKGLDSVCHASIGPQKGDT